MDCNEAKTLVQDFSEGRLSLRKTAAVLKHLRTCSVCYEELETCCLIRMANDSLEDRDVSYDLKKLVKSVLEKQEKRLKYSKILTVFICLLILGASALLVLYLNGVL